MRSFVLLSLMSLMGCAGLTPRLVDASVQKPSNVAVYFTVDTRDGEPVPGLKADEFHIYEDDKLVSPYESKQTILNPEVAAEHYLLLLVDLSGSVTESGNLAPLQDAVNRFTSRVAQYQKLAVYGFDGRADIVQLRAFGPGTANLNLAGFKSADPSTNLNGAVVKAVQALEKQLDAATAPLRFGTLVIFTDGTDHAHRMTRDQALDELRQVDFETFVIGVGAEIDEKELAAFSKTGSALSKDPASVGSQFDLIAERIEGFSKRFYLLSYCSPARAGVHKLRVEPFLSDGKSGSLEYTFDANGFGPQCDPNRKPNFDVRRPRMNKKLSPR